MANKRFEWPCKVEAHTNNMAGRRVHMSRQYEGGGRIYTGALAAILSRKDRGQEFLGCEIKITTPRDTYTGILEEKDGRRCIMGEGNEILAIEP